MEGTTGSSCESTGSRNGTWGPLFVVGMSRAGTTWLSNCLQTHSKLTVVPETAFWGRSYVAPGSDGRYDHAQLDKLATRLTESLEFSITSKGVAYRQISPESCAQLVHDALLGPHRPLTPGESFERILEAVARAEGKAVAVEKTPHHVNWVERILRQLPHSRFVVLVREPHGFALSYKHQGDRQPPDVRTSFEALYHPLVCAWTWRRYAQAALAVVRDHPQQALLVRLEDMAARPGPTLERAQRFFGLIPEDLHTTEVARNTSFPDGCRPQLSAADLYWIDRLGARLMVSMEWPRRPVPRSRLAILRSLLVLPLWTARNWARLMSQSSSVWYYLSWISGPRARRDPPRN